jgi:hypothetical protein
MLKIALVLVLFVIGVLAMRRLARSVKFFGSKPNIYKQEVLTHMSSLRQLSNYRLQCMYIDLDEHAVGGEMNAEEEALVAVLAERQSQRDS